jgi:hypothetical protein
MTPSTSLICRGRPRRLALAVHLIAWLVVGLALLLASQGCGNGHKQCAAMIVGGCSDMPVSANACLQADGCSVGPTCIRVSCTSIEMESACKALSTCYWLPEPGSCVSDTTSDPCVGLTEQPCGAEKNCAWQVTCNGQIKNCVGLNETECAAIPHCYMETAPDF